MAYTSFLLVFSALCVFGFLLLSSTRRPTPKKGSTYPPGPPGKPLVGNLPEIPEKHSWLKFKEWSDQYGALFRFNVAGKDHYVASTEKVANDLLRERGGIYSSREQLPAAVKLLSNDLRPLFWPYNGMIERPSSWWNRQLTRFRHLARWPQANASSHERYSCWQLPADPKPGISANGS